MLSPLIRQMLYPAPPVPVPSPPPAPLEEAWLELPDGERASAWASVRDVASRPVVVFLHGNGENLETVRLSGLFEQLASLDVHVLALDFPGYGNSTGQPSEATLTATGEAGLAWASEHYPDSPKIVMGWSLGAAAAMQAVSRHADDVDGLVLLSAWADLPSLAEMHYPAWLVNAGLDDRYDSVAAASQIACPVLQIHGDYDQIIPIAEGRRLRDALGEGVHFIELPGVGHNDLMAFAKVWQEIAGFLDPLGSS